MNILSNGQWPSIRFLDTVDGDGTDGGGSEGTVEGTGSSTLSDEQIGTLNLSDEQKEFFNDAEKVKALFEAGGDEELKFSDEQKVTLSQLIESSKTDVSDIDSAPEVYSDYLVPKGMELDKALVEQINPVFKELNLNQEQAQKVVDTYAKSVQDATVARQNDYDSKVADWEKQVKEDKDLGGDNFDETKRLSSEAVKSLGTPELSAFLAEYGIGSHPEIVRILVKVGKLVAEDSPGGGTPPLGDKTPLSDKMYKTDSAAA